MTRRFGSGGRKERRVLPGERCYRTRVTCPRCGRPGCLVAGAGLYPFVEHRADPEINSGPSPCWVPRDHPLVLGLLAGGGRKAGAA